MKVVKNRFLPFKGFAYMAFFWWILTREDENVKITPQQYNHENIHLCQIYGVWCIFGPLLLVLCEFGVLSPWWLLALPFAYYELYFVAWVIELLLPPYKTAYRDSCFEREARANASNYNYCCFKHWFSWIKYFLWKR